MTSSSATEPTTTEAAPDAFGNMTFVTMGVDGLPHQLFSGSEGSPTTAPGDGGVGPASGRGGGSWRSGEGQPAPDTCFNINQIPCSQRPSRFSGIAWYDRMLHDESPDVNFLGCFSASRHVLRRAEDAFRHALVAILPAAVLVFEPTAASNWVVPSMIIVMAMVTPQRTTGVTYLVAASLLRSMIVFLVVFEICLSWNPAVHWAAWGATFIGATLLIGTFTEGLTTKISLFFYTIHMVLHYSGIISKTREVPAGTPSSSAKYPHMFPLHFLAPVLVGWSLGVLVPTFPFPRSDFAIAQFHLNGLFRGISILFDGISASVPYCESNVQRTLNLARLRSCRQSIQGYVPTIRQCLFMSMYEPWISATQRSRLRGRLQLAEQLLSSIDAMIQFTSEVVAQPTAIDTLPKSRMFGQHLRAAGVGAGQFIEELCEHLHDVTAPITAEHRVKIDQVRRFVNRAYILGRAATVVHSRTFQDAEPSDETVNDGIKRGVTLSGGCECCEVDFPFLEFGFFLFNYGNFIATLANYDVSGGCEIEADSETSWLAWCLLSPIGHVRDFKNQVVALFVHRDPAAWRKCREAAKLAFAMITALAFFFATASPDPAGGAAVIAFVKGSDPSSNVVDSMNQVLGTVLGSIIGFVAASSARNSIDLVAYITVATVVLGFVKTGRRFGPLGFVSLFFALLSMSGGGGDPLALVARIQQNVIGMGWLVLTHIVIFPVWPSKTFSVHLRSSLDFLRVTLQSISCCVSSQSSVLGKARLEELRGQLAALEATLPSCINEPNVKKNDYPAMEARRIVAAIRSIEAMVAPAMLAVRFTMRFRDAELAITDPSKRSVAWTALESFGPEVRDISVHIDELLRNVEAAVTGKVRSDLAADLLAIHGRLSLAIARLQDTQQRVFIISIEEANEGKRPHAEPYRMPALHTMEHFYSSLRGTLLELTLAAIQWNHAAANF